MKKMLLSVNECKNKATSQVVPHYLIFFHSVSVYTKECSIKQSRIGPNWNMLFQVNDFYSLFFFILF